MEPERSWRDLSGSWERLRWARVRAGFETARAGAAFLGINENTYSAYERRPGSSKHIALDHQMASRLARRFKVDWEWLLTGAGEPEPRDDDPEAKRIAIKVRDLPEEDREIVMRVIDGLGRAR